MITKLTPYVRWLQRGLNRATADIERPLRQAQSLLTASTEEPATDSLYGSTLPSGYIRLLTVLSADDTSVICELQTYEQRLAPRYDAVSYCWGTDITPATVVCNGFALEVRRSVLPLLRTCLQRDVPSRPIWIDAICLDQGNSDEKAIQVPLMTEIYKRSSRTIIWLGEPDSSTEDTIGWIKAMSHWLHERTVRTGWSILGKVGRGLEEVGIEIFGEEEWGTKWQRTNEYLSRPWFRRLWTVQEVLLSWDVQVMCGTPNINMIPWKELCLFTDGLRIASGLERVAPNAVGSMTGHWTGLTQSVHFIEMTRKMLQRRYIPMVVLNEFGRDRGCTEPIDRLWGFLGLMSPTLVARIQDAKIIDYSEQSRREYWRSYIAFTKVLYECDQEDFFSLIFDDIGRRRTSPMPSWCVDFSAQRRYSALQTCRTLRAGFTGSKDRAVIRSSMDQVTNTLGIAGFFEDSVAQVTTEYSNEGDEQQSSKELSLWLRECSRLQEMAKYEDAGLVSTKALCSTLFAVDQQDDRYSSALLDAFIKLLEWHETFYETGEQELEAFSSSIPAAETEDRRAAFEQLLALVTACSNRRVFVTQRGHLGLGPPGLQAGDNICVFLGAESMFALRQTGKKTSGRECFKLVGDAYVYDMMFGGAFGEAFSNPACGALRKFDIV